MIEKHHNKYNIELGKYDSFQDAIDYEYVFWFACLILLFWMIV